MNIPHPSFPVSRPVHVVLFTGGRGSRILSAPLVSAPEVTLTLAINGYDDGASTGEVRRFLGDCLGPSDFRKNAGWLARTRGSCRAELVDVLESRLPAPCSHEQAVALFGFCRGDVSAPEHDTTANVRSLINQLHPEERASVGQRLAVFESELRTSGRPFSFDDCSLGNLVFAGCFLEAGRAFNRAVDAYARLVGLDEGMIQNVTDGTNAHLVAVDREGRLLGREDDVVDARRKNRLRDIHLVDRAPAPHELEALTSEGAVEEFIRAHTRSVALNPQLEARLGAADLIIYSPGTQHSSLFPSYLTPGLSTAIARNLGALKLLVTNLREDADISDSSAVDLIDRAVFYLKERNRLAIPTPCLITHYLLNDPRTESTADSPALSYVPLGRLETLEDPRLVRIANYEDGVTGRHDAGKVLAPFFESLLSRPRPQKLAVYLQHSESPDKVTQTILEMIRGGIRELRIDVTVFHEGAPLQPEFLESVGFEIRRVEARRDEADADLRATLLRERFDYLVLFDTSGMYRGEDIAALASHLTLGTIAAVWGSRRLSVREIHESYRLRYRRTPLVGAASYLGSHLLSLAYLVCYGRYVSDTLSGVKAIRTRFLDRLDAPLSSLQANHQLLSAVLREKADLLEAPVHFVSISPERVRRPGVVDGLLSLANVFRWRLAPPPGRIGQQTGPEPALEFRGPKEARPTHHVSGR